MVKRLSRKQQKVIRNVAHNIINYWHKELKGNYLIEVDGGINPETAAECIKAGADILVAGTAIFSTDDYETNIKALRQN